MNIKFLKDEDGEDWDVGDTITIESEIRFSEVFSEDENLVNIDTVNITITGYNGNEVVTSQAMQNHATGQYFFEWDTTGLDAGDYEVEIDASNSIGEIETGWIKLKD